MGNIGAEIYLEKQFIAKQVAVANNGVHSWPNKKWYALTNETGGIGYHLSGHRCCDSCQINRGLYTRLPTLYCILFRGFISLRDIDELWWSHSLTGVVPKIRGSSVVIICFRCGRGALVMNNYSTTEFCISNWHSIL